MRVELIADGGAAASSEQFFRSPPFLGAEGVTHTLRIEAGTTPGEEPEAGADGEIGYQGELLAPLVVREIPGTDGERDAVSPYGYPGIAIASPPNPADPDGAASKTAPPDQVLPADPAAMKLGSTGLVSIFIRHALGDPPLAGSSERNVVQIADPRLSPKSRASDRNQINRNRRAGYEVRIHSGPEASAADRAGFLAAYEQTMRRAAAAERYFFAAPYFDRLLESSTAWLVLVHAPDGGVAAASIATRSDGFLHYYLSGTADAHLRDSPMKNLVAALVEMAAELGLPLNLGGGISRGDRLEEFKRGFANREIAWRVSEIVCDRAAYARLSAGREPAGFFPAYRSP